MSLWQFGDVGIRKDTSNFHQAVSLINFQSFLPHTTASL